MRQDDFERGMEKEQIVLQGMETVLRMLETLVKAKKYSDQQMEGFRALLKYARQGGKIRCDVIEPEEFEIFRELLEEHAVAYGATTFKDAEGEERVTVMYKDEDEGRMREEGLSEHELHGLNLMLFICLVCLWHQNFL